MDKLSPLTGTEPRWTVTDLDCAALAEDDSYAVHGDHHGSDVGNLPVAPSVLVLGRHGEVRQSRRRVAEFGQGVGAGAHVVVGALIEGGVVRVTRHGAYTVP